MQLISLQSGSSGNCIYVESQGIRLLFDAGLSATQVAQRLGASGRSAEGADALFISHEHYDHIRCAESYARKFRVPLYATERTLRASRYPIKAGRGIDVQHFRSGASVKIGHLTIDTVSTPHDAADGVVFVVDDGEHRLGICTDVGHVFGDLKSLVKNVDGLFLESNFDEEMLANGGYPQRLKQRISGSRGHISNDDAAELVAKFANEKLQWLCLAHLSEKNNSPRRALAAHRRAMGNELKIQVTSRNRASDPLEISRDRPGSSLHRQLTFDF